MIKPVKIFVLFILLTSFSSQLFSQGAVISEKWKVKGFGLSYGYDMDMVKGLDYQYFISLIPQNENPTIYSNMNLVKEYEQSMICENPHLRANVTLLPPKLKNTELNLALLGIFNRIDMVEYATPGANWNETNYQTMTFTSRSSELALEATLIRRIPLFGKTFNLYVGAGSNLGYSFAGDLEVYGSNVTVSNEEIVGIYEGPENPDYTNVEWFEENYKTRNGISQRVFGQLGLSALIFQRFELGIEYRQGIGYRYIPDAELKMTHLKSGGLTARWHFR